MATVLKTIPWSFLTHTANVATNTTFGTTTTHTFGPIDVELETGRTIKAAWLEWSFQTQHTAAADLDGVEVGIDVNAGGLTTTQYTLTSANTGENECVVGIHDVTAALIADLDAGVTQSIEATLAVVTGAASNVACLTCTLYVTYECANDGSAYFTCVDIMIQSHHAAISDTFIEIGTTGATGGEDAPVNQIPQLTGSGGLLDNGLGFVAIHQAKLHLFARIGNTTTTDQQLRVSLDAGSTSNSRTAVEGALAHRVEYRDIVDLMGGDSNMTLTTTAAAALHAANAVAESGIEGLGGFVRVVYEVDPATATRELHNVRASMADFDNGTLANNSLADGALFSCDLHIQEPGPIVMMRSGFCSLAQNATNQNANNNMHARGQLNATNGLETTGRLWQTANIAAAGQRYWFQRADHSWSTWMLGRGKNSLGVEFCLQGSATPPTMLAMVTYLSGIPTAGLGVGNRTVGWPIKAISENSANAAITETGLLVVPDISDSEAEWAISDVTADFNVRAGFGGAPVSFCLERNANEHMGGGFVGAMIDGTTLGIGEMGHLQFCMPLTRWFHTRKFEETTRSGERMRLEADRRTSFPGSIQRSVYALLWATYHCVKFDVPITYTIDGVVAVTGASKVRLLGGVNDTVDTYEVVRRAQDITLDGSGAATVEVTDDTVPYQAVGLDTTARASSAELHPTGALTGNPFIVERGLGWNTVSDAATLDTPVMPRRQRVWDVVYYAFTTVGGDAVVVDDDRGFTFETAQDTGAGGARLTIAWRRIEPDDVLPIQGPDLGAASNYIAAFPLLVRGCRRTGTPHEDLQGTTAATSTTVNHPGVTTTGANRLILAFGAHELDTGAPRSTNANVWTCTALIGGAREYGAHGTSLSTGGGVWVVGGIKESSGATGTIDGTIVTTSPQALITVAVVPHAPTGGTLAIAPVAGGSGGGYPLSRVVNGC